MSAIALRQQSQLQKGGQQLACALRQLGQNGPRERELLCAGRLFIAVCPAPARKYAILYCMEKVPTLSDFARGPIRTPVRLSRSRNASARGPTLSSMPTGVMRAIWREWVSMIEDLLAQGFTKTAISARSGLSPTCGLSSKTHRYVLYLRETDWARRPKNTPQTHCSSSAQPWSSMKAARSLLSAMRCLAGQEVAEEHPGMARRAEIALHRVERLAGKECLDAA